MYLIIKIFIYIDVTSTKLEANIFISVEVDFKAVIVFLTPAL
ncbi:hypothetical protein SARI_01154 [Salmonella enterica subsp. arizonae serovar 62:z4,z23:-]|uniref:Uncharacterized protein n=1 Tax=Salmonella arizonae (strain ATCC BAA-731 / CDC346-86 / RSK2980) TaxID=41514 RepID=A9MP78_SALAR|nr:hypothetical protein SARI_01154 [Salmonella enterica subsp. arizonae serovar 62:z4,z23:-]